MSPKTPVTVASTEAGLAHARDLRAARERQLALIAIAAGNAAARRPVRSATVVASVPKEEPLSEERRRRRAQIRRLGICGPVDPDAPAIALGRPAPTAP